MDIYIKPAKKAAIAGQDKITVKDFVDVVATRDVADAVKKIKILDIKEYAREHEMKNGKAQILISVTDVIKAIKKSYPDYTVNNVGEIDTVIDYKAEESRDNRLWKGLKIAFVSLILMAGSSTAIMSFHTDAEIPKVFKNYYKIFLGEESEKTNIIDIPYSIGLGVGIIIFFNHFVGKKITDDPTPIEVEMSLYDNEITDTVIDTLDAQSHAPEKKAEDD